MFCFFEITKYISVPIDDKNDEKISWGQLKITTNQVFFRSTLSFALVNRKPVVPGREFIFHNSNISFYVISIQMFLFHLFVLLNVLLN
jgi:hypothetical protein